jgi:hypothetical protein
MNPTPRPSLMGMLKGLPRATPTVLHVEQHGEDFFGVPFPANCVTLARQVVEDARRRAHAAGVPGDSPYPAATGRFGWQALLFKRAFNVALATRPPEQDDEPDDMLAALRDEPLVDHSVTEPLDGTPHPVVSAAKWQTTPRHLAARKAAEAPLATPRPPVRRYEVIDEIPFGHHDPILDAADRKRCAEIAVIRAGYQSVAPPQPIVAPRTPIRGDEGYIYEPAEEEAEEDVSEFDTVVSPPPDVLTVAYKSGAESTLS